MYACAKQNNIINTVNSINFNSNQNCSDVNLIVNETISNATCGIYGQAFTCNLLRERIYTYYNNSNCQIDFFCLVPEEYNSGYVAYNFIFLFLFLSSISVIIE